MSQTHLFGSKDHSYNLKVHGPILPPAAQNVVARGGARVPHQEVSVFLEQGLCSLKTTQRVNVNRHVFRLLHKISS